MGTIFVTHDLGVAAEIADRVAVNRQLLTYDALITATALASAPRFDDFTPGVLPNWPIQTMPFNVTGNPALSVPTGFSASGLPLGMQIVGRAFDEATVLRIGAAFEVATGLHGMRPALAQAASQGCAPAVRSAVSA